ncbi:MAG: aminopeptidase [Bacteroidales bacterium]|nr:aminopeptidase [Candidatus Cacconaster merdequi]
MKRIFLLALAALGVTAAFAQTQTIYTFTPVKDIKVTEVKDQAQTGTCWCFATTSFLEAELIRQGKGEFDLSEMFTVRNNYRERIFDNYLRGGKGNINPGSIAHMATNAVQKYGIVPESAYHGINYSSDKHNHKELSDMIKAVASVAVERKCQSPEYLKVMDAIFDTYLGQVPDTFEYEGKTYTAKSFAEKIGFGDMSDYVEIASFSHHPFYEKISVEVPDNWDHQQIYNIPLEELAEVIDNALTNGFTVAWDGDLTSTFCHKNGIAIEPASVDDYAEAVKFEKKFPELVVTQENKQADFETFKTIDDHLMHLTGLFKDQDGNYFYKTKNSWGKDSNQEGGYLYMSRSYTLMRNISIMVHKDAVPKAIRKKLGL